MPGPDDPQLSPRERETLRHLAAGRTTAQIARAMGVAKSTVRAYVRHLYADLDVRTRAEAVSAGRRLGLIKESPS